VDVGVLRGVGPWRIVLACVDVGVLKGGLEEISGNRLVIEKGMFPTAQLKPEEVGFIAVMTEEIPSMGIDPARVVKISLLQSVLLASAWMRGNT
jgi:hypothetical protein